MEDPRKSEMGTPQQLKNMDFKTSDSKKEAPLSKLFQDSDEEDIQESEKDDDRLHDPKKSRLETYLDQKRNNVSDDEEDNDAIDNRQSNQVDPIRISNSIQSNSIAVRELAQSDVDTQLAEQVTYKKTKCHKP